MVFMFSKGSILGGKPFLIASRKQGVLNVFVLYCAIYLCANCYQTTVLSIKGYGLGLLVWMLFATHC